MRRKPLRAARGFDDTVIKGLTDQSIIDGMFSGKARMNQDTYLGSAALMRL
jgi:hypothetical protein